MNNWPAFKEQTFAYLCPPGNGVYTVNTAKERKASLHQALYGQKDDVEKLWQAQLEQLPNYQGNAVIFGVCSDAGGGILRGANWGPLFVRNTLLANHPELDAFDLGDVRVIPHLLHDKYLNDKTINNCRKALYQTQDTEKFVSPLSIAEAIADSFYAHFPNKGLFSIGGDHSVSYPLTKAYLKAKRAQNIRTAIIHFDAHTDLLIERLGIDLCFGSWCTHILEYLPSPGHLHQIGIRSTAKPKSHWEETFGVKQYWAKEVKEQGANSIAEQILENLKHQQVDELYISFDIDGIDAKFASATGTPEADGLMPDDARIIIEQLSSHYAVTAADMVEIAPFVNTAEDPLQEPETTLTVGAKLSAQMIKAIQGGKKQ